MHHQERSCARQNLDVTEIGRCMGRDDLGRLLGHAVADGGSRIEVDEESYS